MIRNATFALRSGSFLFMKICHENIPWAVVTFCDVLNCAFFLYPVSGFGVLKVSVHCYASYSYYFLPLPVSVF